MLAIRYPTKSGRAFVAIPNGYDEEDFAAVGDLGEPSLNELLIVHTGSINQDFRDPRPMFEALREAAAAGLVDLSRIRIRFLGGGPFGESSAMQQAIERAGLLSRVEFRPRVSYETSLAELSRAGILLLLQASLDTVELVPAKLFEYLRAGRPVIALVPEGATAEVLRDTGGGWVVDPRDASALRRTIVAAYQRWANHHLGSLTADRAALEKFSRERLAGILAAQFDALVDSEHSSI
jgi:glycosyltransferase involved in cell wall biosynthesis